MIRFSYNCSVCGKEFNRQMKIHSPCRCPECTDGKESDSDILDWLFKYCTIELKEPRFDANHGTRDWTEFNNRIQILEKMKEMNHYNPEVGYLDLDR